jgi:hypothetical protein
MAKKKVVEEVVEPVVEAPVVEAPPVQPMPAAKTKPMVTVVAARVDMWHPFQHRPIFVAEPVEVVMDNWLQGQIDANHIKVVE